MKNLFSLQVETAQPKLLDYLQDNTSFYVSTIQEAIQLAKECYYFKHATNVCETATKLSFEIDMYGMQGKCVLDDSLTDFWKYAIN